MSNTEYTIYIDDNNYRELYEEMKEKQTTTFAMMMKVMGENEAKDKLLDLLENMIKMRGGQNAWEGLEVVISKR